MKNIKKYFIGMILFIMIICGGGDVYALVKCLDCGIFSEYSKINYGATYSINNSILNANVKNNSSSLIYFIPYNTTDEWNAFKDNTPSDLTITYSWILSSSSFPMILK